MDFLDLVSIGSKVKVNVKASKDRLNAKTIDALGISSECIVSDFRITDGKGIGVILELTNGEKEWFFENEIDILDENGNIITRKNSYENKLISLDFLNNFKYRLKESPKKLANPFNFFSWLIFSLKDIF